MDEANKIKEETTDVELTTATLAGVDARPEVRAVAGSTLVSAVLHPPEPQPLRLLTSRRRRSFRPKKRRIFAPGGIRSKWVLLMILDWW